MLDVKNELKPVNFNGFVTSLDNFWVRELAGLPITPQGQQIQISLFDLYGKTKRVLQAPDYTYTIYFLVVGGGGGGGSGRRDRSGAAGSGGGGGGYSVGELLVESSSWTNGYIVVGNAGAARGNEAGPGTNGYSSELHMATRGVLNYITSQGGEGGRGGELAEGRRGGTGGAGFDNQGGGNGQSPGFSAGGGGPGGDDRTAGEWNKGGNGVRWGVDGVTYSGGGGGGGDGGNNPPNGGLGGGGSGRSSAPGEPGQFNLGGGGGGGASWGNNAWNPGAPGGSGQVKIAYNKAYTQLFYIPGASFEVGDYWMTHTALLDNLALTTEFKPIYFIGPRIPPFAAQSLEYIIP
jgi:hypothetical protein